jgi:3-hydroxybutyryl-CoA dehydrogenase
MARDCAKIRGHAIRGGDMSVVKAEDVKRACVLGAGTMGHGIAQVCAAAGLEVTLRDVEERFVEAGLRKIQANLEIGVQKGKLTGEQRDHTLARLRGTTSLEAAVTGADVVIEAIPEDMRLKRETIAAVEAAAPAHALLASNTSSLSLAAIAEQASRPERVVGMHFFNPVHLMKLCEIVRHDGASDDAVTCARELAVRLGKEPIIARDVPGFASSRLGVALGLEAIRMVEQGVASAGDIDKAMKLGYGHPMGPLELGDHVGLDVRLAIAEYLQRELGPSFEPPALLREKVAAGKLGKKTGEGFYRWQDGKIVG